MANNFDVVAIRVQHKPTKVMFMIVRAHTWRTVVATAACHCSLVKIFHRRTFFGTERNVAACMHLVCVQPEIGLATHAKTRSHGSVRRKLHNQFVTQWRQCGAVKFNALG